MFGMSAHSTLYLALARCGITIVRLDISMLPQQDSN